MEVIGTGIVEQKNKDRAPVLIELPSARPEVTALGMADPKILEEAQQIIPTLLLSPETRPDSPADGSGPTLEAED